MQIDAKNLMNFHVFFRAASIRLASSFWWFFTLIMVSSYTANLAMFLVIENKTSKISSVDDLKDCGVEGKTCPIKFGAKKGGATFMFFKVYTMKLRLKLAESIYLFQILFCFEKESQNDLYKSMYKYMEENKDDVLTNNNDEGIARVYNSGDGEYRR